MKKIIIMAITLCLVLSLTACSCSGCKSTPPTPEASYFLADYKIKDVMPVNEVAKYEIKFTNNGETASNGITPNATGIFTTTLTNTTLDLSYGETTNIVKCYMLTTSYELNGSYTYKNQTYPIADRIYSTVCFLGVKDNLKPIQAMRQVVCTTPYLEYSANKVNDIEFLNYNFEYVIDYTGKDAIMMFNDNLGNLDKPESTIIKNFYSNTFVENELLYFYPRAFKLNSGFSTTRQVVTVDGKIDLNMKVSSFNSDFQWKVDGDKTHNVKVDVVQYTNTGRYTTAPISVYFANVNDTNNLFRAPVKIQSFVTLVGGFEYNLVSFSHN